MGAETVVDKVRAIAERVAGGYGLEIFDVQYRREAPGMVLRVRIDRPGPASTPAAMVFRPSDTPLASKSADTPESRSRRSIKFRESSSDHSLPLPSRLILEDPSIKA